MENLDFEKGNGLIPAVVQDAATLKVLMVGFMNREAYRRTVKEGRVTFFSRSRNRLWTKGETSGNFLIVNKITIDCDRDTLLIQATPKGPVCHTGSKSCFGDDSPKGFVYELEQIIGSRIEENAEGSYTNSLFRKGAGKVAQKVGEEAVELVIEAMGTDDELFRNEAADLMYHFLILLKTKGVQFLDIEQVLFLRHNKSVK
jgi:phosphoribosyl-AMP cyclohydrolase / phosphoribosyl-ATP pyrophosphohydrolase